jgi:hypothetical protein
MLGGSVTAGAGSSSPPFSYPAQFGSWLNATFPHPGTEVLNRGIGATTSGIFSLCAQKMMPEVGGWVRLGGVWECLWGVGVAEGCTQGEHGSGPRGRGHHADGAMKAVLPCIQRVVVLWEKLIDSGVRPAWCPWRNACGRHWLCK